jgi:hypothetical protein
VQSFSSSSVTDAPVLEVKTPVLLEQKVPVKREGEGMGKEERGSF